MGTLIVLVVFALVLIAWGALSVYMARADRFVVRTSVDARRDVVVLPDGREITRQEWREITVRLTVDAQRFTEAIQKVGDGLRASLPNVKQFGAAIAKLADDMPPLERMLWQASKQGPDA